MAWNDNYTDFPFRLLNCDRITNDVPTQIWKRHDFQYFTAEYVLRGEGTVQQDQHRFPAVANDVYLLHLHHDHCFWPRPENPWNKVFFIVDGKLVAELIRAYKLETIEHLSNAQNLRRHFDAMESLHMSGPRLNERAALIFHEFVADVARLCEGPQPAIPEAALRLKERLEGSLHIKFELNLYANDVQLSAAHLIRIFRQSFGCPPGDYLLRLRIEQAQRMLTYSNYSIKEIAAELCFSDQYYFSNYFKQRIGCSPSEFRQSNRCGLKIES